MTKLIHREGNIFDTDAQAIGHGVNIDGKMASGIAVQFREKFPEMHDAYVAYCDNGFLVPGAVFPWKENEHLSILNIASQDRPGPSARYGWLSSGLSKALRIAEQIGVDRLAIPRIGSGVGGLDAVLTEGLFESLAEGFNVDIELWTYKS